MSKYVHHNNNTESHKGPILTLGDLYALIGSCDLPASKRDPIRSAIKRVDELVGHGALDLPANAGLVMKQLDAWSPAMADMSDGAFANLKSRLRAAFRFAKPGLPNPRARTALVGAWRELQMTLDVPTQRTLSRLFHFAAAQGWEPDHIADDQIDRFALHLRDEAMVAGWENVTRSTIRAWNKLPTIGLDGGLRHLTPPPPKRTPYWIAIDQWPVGLRSDLEALTKRLSNPNLYGAKKARKLSPKTVEQYRHTTSTLVSATVASGVPLERLQRLTDALAPDHVVAALEFLGERGGTITATMMQMMIRTLVMARMCDLPDEAQQELQAIYRNMEANAPSDLNRRRMADKNRELLKRLEHDQRFADLVHNLPNILAKEARALPHARIAPSRMRAALAIDLLLTCAMRRENLVALELGKSIKRMGKQPHHFWVIEFKGDEVKNDQELRYKLEGEAVALLDEYVAEWRSKLSPAPNAWLFPGPDGEMIDPRAMAVSIQTNTARILGVEITPHQFRHISAESFLLEHPDKLQLVSDHLGHRDPNTTRAYYARPKQKQASRVLQEHVLKARKGAALRLGSRKRKSRHSGKEDCK